MKKIEARNDIEVTQKCIRLKHYSSYYNVTSASLKYDYLLYSKLFFWNEEW